MKSSFQDLHHNNFKNFVIIILQKENRKKVQKEKHTFSFQ